MQLCDYGCGKEAKYQFKNEKWCCSKNISKCDGIIHKLKNRKVSIETRQKQSYSLMGRDVWNKNKNISEEHKLKIGLGNKNKIISDDTRKKISNSMIGKKSHLGFKHSDETKQKISKSKIGKSSWNKNKKHSKKTLKILKIANKLTISQIKERYPTFAKVEEMRYEPGFKKEKVIQVHCKNHNCSNSKEQGGWFTPKYKQIAYRTFSVEKEAGNEAGYFYCSNKCKHECSLYNKKVVTLIKQDKIKAGQLKNSWYTSEEYQIWRQQVFKLDDNKCIYCGEKATVAHHILPQKTHPELSLDPENGLSVCQECHFKYSHRDPWCTTGKLSTLVCERIINNVHKAKLSK